jgi:hypothetical protein
MSINPVSNLINPVKATCKKYNETPDAIQGMNDTCFGICAAYSGTNDVYNMDPQCSKLCTDFIENKKKEIFGVGSCDHQVPYRPVIWEQTPRFFPQLIKNYPKEESLKLCISKCDRTTYPSQCKEDCITDSDAIEEFKNISVHSSISSSTSNQQSNEDDTKLIIAFILILLFLIGGSFIYIIQSKM